MCVESLCSNCCCLLCATSVLGGCLPSLWVLCLHLEANVQTLLYNADIVLLVLTVITDCSHSMASTSVTQALEALEAVHLGPDPADEAGIALLPIALSLAADAAAHKAPVP